MAAGLSDRPPFLLREPRPDQARRTPSRRLESSFSQGAE